MTEKKLVIAKSSPKKRTDKQQEPKPMTDVQPMVEQVKPREINWDVLGFSSAAVTLLGAGLLFMLGWAYEANWYGYFGVGISQVNVAPQQILIQSIPATITTLASWFISLIFFVMIRMAPLARQYYKKNTSVFKPLEFASGDWILILLLFAIMNAFFVLFTSNASPYNLLHVSNKDVYEIYYLGYFSLYTIPPILILLLFLWFLSHRSSENDLTSKQRNYATVLKISIARALVRFSPLFLLVYIIMSSLSLSALYGINDAALGRIGSGGWHIQKVQVSVHYKIEALHEMVISCDESTCVYGPFGLLGQDDNSYILILWKKEGVDYFDYNSGLFIFPRNDVTISPFNDSSQITIPAPLATPTLAPLPAQTIATPKPRSTAVPTLSQSFTSTPTQP